MLRPNKIYQIRGPVNIRHTFKLFIMSKYIFSAQNPLEQFELTPLINIGSASGFDLSFTNSSLITLLAITFFVLLARLVFYTGNGTLIPNRWQSVLESMYELVAGLLNDNVGTRGQGYFPFLFSLFAFLLMVNLIGMVPYSYTITSQLIVTLLFSGMVYIGVTIIMVRTHGFLTLSVFLPGGAPFALYPLLIPIEIISNVMRVVSLAVRLFANMMAGHILLKVLLGFAWTMMMAQGILFILHMVPMGVVFVLLFLETGVAVIQAYVFVTLTCIYFNEAINLH